MKADFLMRGLAIGLSIAAPVGPIGMLCIRRTLATGRMSGLVSGLGAATADGIYGVIAAFGLTTISNLLVNQQTPLRIIGGLFLCFLGVKTFLSKPASEAANAKAIGLAADYTSTFLLTLTNPMTILSFAAVFAGLGLGRTTGDYPAAALLVIGVFLGSAFWWLLLSTGTGLFREKFDSGKLRWVNRLSGAIIFIFGLIALVNWRK